MRTVTLQNALASLVLLLAAGCAPAATTGEAPAGGQLVAFGASAQTLAEGRRLFQGEGRCSACHGQTGVGGRGPDLTDNEWLWIRPERPDYQTQLMTLIRIGVPQPRESQAPMPAMGGAQLFEGQIEALAVYVASLSQM